MDLNLFILSDEDWASSLDYRRSTPDYCFMLSQNGPVISWKSKKQSSVAFSTNETEYIVLASICQEIAYMTQFLKDFLRDETLMTSMKIVQLSRSPPS